MSWCHMGYGVEKCNFCPRFMDDCDGMVGHIIGEEDDEE